MADQKVLDPYGRPVNRAVLTQEIAAPTIGGVRSPVTGYPGDGLNPERLAAILREADLGDPVRYLELAETIEERDAHYLGVLGTRRRAVSQLEITVEEGDESPAATEMADRVRAWIRRDELTDELFDILDAIGKGFSVTEIIWDSSTGQWMPGRLEYRDPRWFRFERQNLTTPLMLEAGGQEVPLAPFKFICARIRAKSGLPLRSGVARVAMWSWMFKAFTQRDWAIFTQTYGQPLRIGKYGPGASEEDRQKLFRAVANIAGDCAAIVPESMMIDFVEAGGVGSSLDLYERRSDWLDKQTSKLVLGQTATTDAETGGLGSGKEHREVQEDIERADARALSAIINRDLIQPWMQLEFGAADRNAYPRVIIARPEAEDLAAFSSALAPMIGAGLTVRSSEIRAKFGLSDPEKGDEVLSAPKPAAKPPETAPDDDDETEEEDTEPQHRIFKYPRAIFKRVGSPLGEFPERQAQESQRPSAGRSGARLPEHDLADRLDAEALPAMAGMMGQIEAMLQAAGSFDEFREMLAAGFGDIDARALAAVIADAMIAADAGGRAMVEDEAADG